MLQYFYNIDAYVEQQKNYNSDSVELKLDEGTLKVTLKLIDVYKNPIADAPLLVDKEFDELEDAIKFYNHIEHQLAQGDINRDYSNNGETIRSSYDADNSRYPSF